MLMLNGAYARYFNWRHDAGGHVFERKYHRETIVREEHLLTCFRYIAQNPVHAKLCERPEDWTWSSYRATAGIAPAPPWLSVEFARELFRPYGGYAYFCNQIATELQSDCAASPPLHGQSAAVADDRGQPRLSPRRIDDLGPA